MIVANGLPAFLTQDAVVDLLHRLTEHFPVGEIAFNGYTRFHTRVLKRYRGTHSIADVVVNPGVDDPRDPERWVPRLLLLVEAILLTRAPEVAGYPFGLRVLTRLAHTARPCPAGAPPCSATAFPKGDLMRLPRKWSAGRRSQARGSDHGQPARVSALLVGHACDAAWAAHRRPTRHAGSGPDPVRARRHPPAGSAPHLPGGRREVVMLSYNNAIIRESETFSPHSPTEVRPRSTISTCG